MAKITLLGTGYAVPEEGHDNTHFFIQQGSHGVLVDCGTNPMPNMRRAGIELDSVTDLILTHFHPDHASGMPMLLMSMWLKGRKAPLDIYGNPHTLERARTLMDMFDWQTWPNFYPTHFHLIPQPALSPVINSPDLRILASPVKHLIPTTGLRIEFVPEGKTAAYSCDTEPVQAVVDLAKGADILFHEAAGPSIGHSSPQQAGEIARKAGARMLYLIHTSPREELYAGMLEQAASAFGGEVHLAHDSEEIELKVRDYQPLRNGSHSEYSLSKRP